MFVFVFFTVLHYRMYSVNIDILNVNIGNIYNTDFHINVNH